MLPSLFVFCIYLLNEIFSSHIMRLFVAIGGITVSKSNENAYELKL